MANGVALEMRNVNIGDDEESDNEPQNAENDTLNGCVNGQSVLFLFSLYRCCAGTNYIVNVE